MKKVDINFDKKIKKDYFFLPGKHFLYETQGGSLNGSVVPCLIVRWAHDHEMHRTPVYI